MNLGQVYTKEIVADFMVGLLDIPKSSEIIDPCFGQGVFIKSLQKAKYKKITGLEIDTVTYNKTDFKVFHQCNLKNIDFFKYNPQNQVDGFILNPPYVRQEDIDEMKELGVTKETIRKKCGDFKIYSKANMYLYFVARCIYLLREGGQMVVIFPNVWVKTPDGKKFFAQIQNKGLINNIIQVSGSPFVGNPLVDVMIMKFTKGGKGETKEETLFINKNGTIELTDGERIERVYSNNCVFLSSIAKVRRGLSTGFNKIFINPQIKSDKFKVDILSTPKDVQGYTTNGAKIDKLLTISSKTKITEAVSTYIENAESIILKKGAPKTLVNLIQSGKKWYSLTLPLKPDIIFPYIIRDNVRFIKNDAKVIVRDNFYSINSSINSYLLLGLLNNYYIYSQLESCGKSYGKGLLKIQKYDIDKLVIPDPNNISLNDREKIIEYAKLLIKYKKSEYIRELSLILEKYYCIGNIETVYKSQKKNRLENEL